MSLTLIDNCKAREQGSNGQYYYVKKGIEEREINSQSLLCEKANQIIEPNELDKNASIKFKHKLVQWGNSYIVKLREVYSSLV